MRETMQDSNTMELLVEELIDILFDNLDIHRELAVLLKKKEQAVIKLDLSGMDEIIEQERAMINQISRIESKRIELTTVIGEKIGRDNPSTLRLSGIVPYVSSEAGYTLIELRDDLRETAHEIELVQNRNRTLISHSLNHIHLFLSVLSGVDPEAKAYSSHGEIKTEAHPAVLDRRF